MKYKETAEKLAEYRSQIAEILRENAKRSSIDRARGSPGL